MQLANQEAQRFNHEYIGTEHVLLGLVKEGSGVAANVLKNLDIDLRKIRLEVEKIVQPGPGGEQVAMGRLPHTPRATKIIMYAIEEARTLGHTHVGTEHLLLGLIWEKEGVASQVMTALGLTADTVRDEVLMLLGVKPAGGVDAKYGEITTTKGRFHPGEPLFVLRAQDRCAAAIIGLYAQLCEINNCPAAHVVAVNAVAETFTRWKEDNPALVKKPD